MCWLGSGGGCSFRMRGGGVTRIQLVHPDGRRVELRGLIDKSRRFLKGKGIKCGLLEELARSVRVAENDLDRPLLKR